MGMDNDGGLGMRHWGAYYEQPQVKGGLSLQLMSAGERDLKDILPSGAFFQRDCGVPEPSVPIEYMRESWMYHHRDNNRMLHALPTNPTYAVPADPLAAGNPHTLQMLEESDLTSKNEQAPAANEPSNTKKGTKKRSRQVDSHKVPKPKKPKRLPVQSDGANNNNDSSASHKKGTKKSTDVVINGNIDLDISGLPTPVCSCTSTPQPCYRWGVGGWQSACCTRNISMHPLPMSTKRRGVRIAGRKMSQGAFKKVLEKLVDEGYNLANPIDLRTHWAKHGTNKFVTIR